jgi:hypothetical protein
MKEGSDLLLCCSSCCLCLCQILIRFKGGSLVISSSICWLLCCPDDLCRLFSLFLLHFSEVQLLQLLASVYDVQPACMQHWFTMLERQSKQARKQASTQGIEQAVTAWMGKTLHCGSVKCEATDCILRLALDAPGDECLTRI